MSTTPPPFPTATAWPRPLYERQIAMLGQMAEGGLELALGIQRKALADLEDSAAGADSAALAYGRVARAVRMTLLLQTRAIEAVQALDRLVEQDAGRAERERKERVEAIVERVASAAHDAGEVERLVYEAAERLDRDDIYGPVMARPVSELVAMICKDLGLDPDWPALTREAWAAEEMTGSAVGWPLAVSLSLRGAVSADSPRPYPDG